MTVIGYSAESAPGQILQFLQRQGESTVKELAELLGVSGTATREHLVHLQAEGLVLARSERHGPGRPRLIYALSEKARARFPQQTDRLVATLLRELIAREGADKLGQLLDAVSLRLANEYADRMAGTDMAARLGELRKLLEQRGVPAEVAADGDGIRLFACPYYEVAASYPEVCSMEQRMIEYVLGEKLTLENSLRAGGHNCHFVRRPNEIALTPMQPAEG